MTAEWEPCYWWRAIGPDGELWAEASDENDVRSRLRPGDRLQRLFEKVEIERTWVEVYDHKTYENKADPAKMLVSAPEFEGAPEYDARYVRQANLPTRKVD